MEEFSDKEQLDAIRGWWGENGNYVVGGIIAGIVILFGWNRWQTATANAEIAASSLYEEVMVAAGRGQLEQADAPSTTLYEEHASSPYAALARLAMARLYMDNSRDQDAANVLRALVGSAPDTELALIGRLRLAKVLLYQGKAEEALWQLKDHADTAFAARYSELMGDAYVSMESYAEARVAYVAALNDERTAPTVDVNLIQLKLNDLPAVGEVAATEQDDLAAETPGERIMSENPEGSADAEIPKDTESSVDEAGDAAVENIEAADNGPEAE